MTGYQLKRIRSKLDLSLRELAERWGVGKSTLQREEDKNEVRGVYADAARYLESQLTDTMTTIESDTIARITNDEVDPIAEWKNFPGDDPGEVGSKITLTRRDDEYILIHRRPRKSKVILVPDDHPGAVTRMASLFCDEKSTIHDEEAWEEIRENYLEVDEEAPYGRDRVFSWLSGHAVTA